MKHTILVVDDSGDIRKLLQDALAEDYNIIEASDGLFGLSEILAGEEHIDLIITDLKMPEVDGLEFIQNLPGDIPFIIISAYLQTPEFCEALEHVHSVATFEKPFRISELREAIHRTLDK